MRGPHSHCPYGRRYDIAVNVLHRGAPEASARIAAMNLADSTIPPYYFIKNCTLASRTQDDKGKVEIYRLNAEHKFTESLRIAKERPDDGSLKVLQDLRTELDQLYASKPAAGPGSGPPSLPALPGLRPASPPPLPGGWLVFVDPGSGHNYYYHILTQSTQWEFPKGPDMTDRDEEDDEVEDEEENQEDEEDVDEEVGAEALNLPNRPAGEQETSISNQDLTPTVNFDPPTDNCSMSPPTVQGMNKLSS